MTQQRPQVIIVGAGFGGLEAAKALRRAPVDVTVRRPAEPSLLPAAALSGGDRGAVAGRHRLADPRTSCARQANATVLMAEVDAASMSRQARRAQRSGALAYDYLIARHRRDAFLFRP